MDVVEEFENGLLKEGKETLKPHEKSEIALFKARIYEEKGEHQKAVDILRKKGLVVDQISKFERLAANYQALGNKEKAIMALE